MRRFRGVVRRVAGATLAVGVAGVVATAVSVGAGNAGAATHKGGNIITGSEGTGYRLVAADGGVFAFGGLSFLGSMGGQPLNKPIVGIASPDPTGYWLVAADGGIFSFGDALYLGSMGGQPLNKPIVGMADVFSNSDNPPQGYWEVAADGGVFSFGAARYFGSMGGRPLSGTIVGIASTGDGGGYWLVSSTGAIYAFGDAQFPSGFTSPPLSTPGANGGPVVTGIASFGSDNSSFVTVSSDGGVFPYLGGMTGNEFPAGPIPSSPTPITFQGITTAVGSFPGWWTAASQGTVFPSGSVQSFGSIPGTTVLNKPIVGIDGY